MKFLHVFSLAALGSAFVIPDEQIFTGLAKEHCHDDHSWVQEATELVDKFASGVKSWGQDAKETIQDAWEHTSQGTVQAFDRAMALASQTHESILDASHGVESWFQSTADDFFNEDDDHHHHPPHHKPGHGRPHHPPPHKNEPNQTVYEIINGSKYTTKLAKLINEYDDLVDILNSTKANYTIFAPIDDAFDKIPEHAPKPSKEEIKAILQYHVIPDFYPAKRVLFSHTAPTSLLVPHLSSKPEHQRIAFKLGLRGLTVNFYSRVIGVNFFATNGVLHGVSSLLLPPPNAIAIINALPSAFSTLELGLSKTGLLDKLNTTDHAGGTIFAPSNRAFGRLGPRVNAFLFSSRGTPYLKALLKYHVVPDFTLYSDAYYKPDGDKESILEDIPNGKYHTDLPTALEGHSLSVDIVKYGGFTKIYLDTFSQVAVSDGIAEDGVIHVVNQVLIPPKKLGGGRANDHAEDAEITVEELEARLAPYIIKSDL